MGTRQVTHVEQELNTVPEHLNSPPIFSWVRTAHSLVFCVMILRSLIILLSFFWGGGVVLSVLLLPVFTASEYIRGYL